MELKQIFNIEKKPGLYIARQSIKGGFMAMSLIDGSYAPVTENSAPAYCLADIELHGIKSNLSLQQVFKSMQQHEPVPANAHESSIKEYFGTIAPGLNPRRVFPSDMRKIINWFNLLKSRNANFGE